MSRTMSKNGLVVTAALVVVPGPGETVTFVRQENGPYAGHWLLPGGKVEFGEPIVDAARREATEESGCAVADVLLSGVWKFFPGSKQPKSAANPRSSSSSAASSTSTT